MNEIFSDIQGHPDVNFRNLIYEKPDSIEGHGGMSSLKFDGEYTWPMQIAGRERAKEALNLPEGETVRRFKNWYKDADL